MVCVGDIRHVGINALGAALSLVLISSEAAQGGTVDRPFFRANAMVIVIGASDYLENGGTAPYVGDFLQLRQSGQAGEDLLPGDMTPINYINNGYSPVSNDRSVGMEYRVTNPTFGGQFTSSAPNQHLGPGDSYTAFGLDGDTDLRLQADNRLSRFFVASNAPFDIFAKADNLVTQGAFSALGYENIRFRFRMQTSGGGANGWGASAQDPDVGGSGVVLGRYNGPLTTLNDLSGAQPVKVYDGGRRTARTRGTLLQQAVGFQSRYNLRATGQTVNGYDFSMGTGLLGADVTFTVYTP